MTKSELRKQSLNYLLQLLGAFAAFLAAYLFFSSNADWAERRTGWEASVVHYLFWGLSLVPGLGAAVFGGLTLFWPLEFRDAMKYADRYKDDPEVYMHYHGGAFGPISKIFRQ